MRSWRKVRINRLINFLNKQVMPKNNITLGLLVLAGLLLFITTLYIIGKNQNMFGSSYTLKARFRDINGLVKGSNVRFAGIQAGTVKKIALLDDTTIEVVMLIDEDLKPFIRSNAMASIGTEGLIGNKVVNIVPGKGSAVIAPEGSLLPVHRVAGTEEMLETLSRTNDNIAVISEELKRTVTRVNESKALWRLLEDESLPRNIRATLVHIRRAGENADRMTGELGELVAGVRNGKGAAGLLLADTAFAARLSASLENIRQAGATVDVAARELNETIGDLHESVNNGRGTLTTLLKDTVVSMRLKNSLDNIEKGTAAFSQDMEALKHNFLFRGYFRKLEKQQKKQAAGHPLTMDE